MVQLVSLQVGGFNTYSGGGYDGALTFSTRQNSTNTMVEEVRITSGEFLVEVLLPMEQGI